MLPPPKPPIAPAPVLAPALVVPDRHDHVLHLMGTTKMTEFLSFARDRADLTVPGTGPVAGTTEMQLAEAWRDAADGFQSVAMAEAYPTGQPTVFPFPQEMQAHTQAFLDKAHVQQEFDRVPVAMGMVPLAHIIAVRHRLNMSTVMAHADAIAAGTISDLKLAQLCLPLEAPRYDVQVVEQDEGGFTVASEHHSFDFLQERSHADAAMALPARGHSAQTLALQFGFPGNVLNVISFGNRFFLNNGYHRAYALWKRGVTHIPAVIQVCRHWEDVALLGNHELYENADVYVDRERPPLIKDFADRLFCTSFAVPRTRKYVRVRYSVETGYMR